MGVIGVCVNQVEVEADNRVGDGMESRNGSSVRPIRRKWCFLSTFSIKSHSVLSFRLPFMMHLSYESPVVEREISPWRSTSRRDVLGAVRRGQIHLEPLVASYFLFESGRGYGGCLKNP
ncbi:hypothetical protein L596_010694 [Steinernema carpocapsae]|uniref:Uncharacterized protein n=1 Tax=Steinernema carpocapsae TaxID=34508 RepID=A0A4U5PJ38_STECR|nr:hypothetical protein L596_010694 [Steinernema carpocapsae]